MSQNILNTYNTFFDELNSLVSITQSKVINEEDDDFVKNNVNFFTKSFTITLCAYLESFIKDISVNYINYCNSKLSTIKISHNIVRWSINKKKELSELSDSELKFEDLKIDIKRQELDDFISGSPYRTEKLFKKFGIELHKDSDYAQIKEKVIAIVNKRNKIMHHNDNASDLSFADIQINILILKEYIKILSKIVNDNCY